MAFLRVFLQVSALSALVCCSPARQTGAREPMVAAPSEALQAVGIDPIAPDQVRMAQEAHVAGSNKFAEVMYEGLADVIQSVMKMVSERVAEAKNFPLE